MGTSLPVDEAPTVRPPEPRGIGAGTGARAGALRARTDAAAPAWVDHYRHERRTDRTDARRSRGGRARRGGGRGRRRRPARRPLDLDVDALRAAGTAREGVRGRVLRPA